MNLKIVLKEDFKMTKEHLYVNVVIKGNKIVKRNKRNVKNAQLEHKELNKKEFQQPMHVLNVNQEHLIMIQEKQVAMIVQKIHNQTHKDH